METVECPRCRAEGAESSVVIHDGYGVCARCETTWNKRKHNQMIAVPEEI